MTVKSNFELDDRIKSIDDIQTILCNNRGFIGLLMEGGNK